MARKSKKITLDFLAKDGGTYDKLKKVTCDNGMVIHIYERFSNQRIDEMLVDCSNFFAEYNKSHKLTEKNIMDYVLLHILYWFTSLSEKSYTFEEKIVLFSNALKSGYSEQIFNHFDQDEIKKAFERMSEKLQIFQKAIAENPETQEQIKEFIENSNLENKEVILETFFEQTEVKGGASIE